MAKKVIYIGLLAGLLAGILLLTHWVGPDSPLAAAENPPQLDLVKLTDQGVEVRFCPPGGRPGTLEAELYNLEGTMLAKVTRRHTGRPETILFVAEVDRRNPANYYVRYRFDAGEKFQQRSLFYLGEILETTILGQKEFVAGTRPVIRILVRDRAAGRPLADAAVVLELIHDNQVIAKLSTRTDARGEAAAGLEMPDRPLENAKLKVVVTTESGTDTVEETIQVRSPIRTLLTTDKPLYQPGQTIHIRALSLVQPSLKPLTQAAVTFEVADAKGNKVFKVQRQTDAFGISHCDFVLANELNMGTFSVRVIAAGMKQEKTVTVERYVLPKFKIQLQTDRNFYQPGERVKGEIQVDYFFGKPVADGKVKITCSKFDLEYQEFQVIEGKTDDQGHYTFEAKLPDHFVGQPLEAGKASAKFEISLIDAADHKETVTKNVSVTAAPILIVAVPESGELISRLDNRIYIVATYADATPAACRISWQAGPKSGDLETDAAGFGQITLAGPEQGGLKLTLAAKDAQGNTGKASVDLTSRARLDDDSILLRTDKSLYRVGESVELSILSTRSQGTVYIDVIKDRQTCLTRTQDLRDGRAADRFNLDGTLAGTVQINAYLIGANGVIVRDRRLIVVDPADDLHIAVASDQQTYRPGGQAKLTFTVTDRRGKPVASALGVMVVDEAVFALQEMQPGLEKVYFYLEKEIATPRYEVHGYELDDCLGPPPSDGPVPMPRPQAGALEGRRDTAARVLFASAKGVGDYPLHVNTYQRDNKAAVFQQKMVDLLMPRYQKISRAFNELAQELKKKDKADQLTTGANLELLRDKGYLRPEDVEDPWGTLMKVAGYWCQSCQNYHGFVLLSAGVDGVWDTADDAAAPPGLAGGMGGFGGFGGFGGTEGWRFRLLEGGVARAGLAEQNGVLAFDMAGPPTAAPPMKALSATSDRSLSDAAGGSSGAGEPIRIRQIFPETLYFNPAVITDGSGRAALDVSLADSITTWRLTAMASSARGQLGSTSAPMRVFQDFFVDIDFPVALTQNDEVHVPVAIFNYLQTDQTIELTVTKEDWFELKGLDRKSVTLAAGEIRAVYFPIVARKIGFQRFTVTARGSQKSDAVARSVEIVPDGREQLVSQSGRLEGTVTHTIAIPAGALEDASKIFVKVYPGVLSQVVEGLDSMLRMPFGCFEQTSSVTYPNILVLDYMKSTGKITPELQMKAEGFINAGYQRLVSFEVDGGGFEWFGKAPAHRILTAYGLMEFFDMSRVHPVDPAIIERTQKWLAACQEKDGSYRPSQGGIAEGAINKFTDDVLRNTAYITWALASTNYQGPELDKGVEYLRGHPDNMKDVYTRVLVVNALATVAPQDKTTLEVLRTLHEMRVETDETAYWQAQSETPTHGTGKAADIETTALAIQAFIRCGQELGTVSKAVAFLVKSKDAHGTWQSTQATIQALRAMLMAERGATARMNATIEVSIHDQTVTTLTVNEDNSDVLQLVDLKDQTRQGNNVVKLNLQGEGSLLYQIVGRYYLPRPAGPVRPDLVIGAEGEPMAIRLDYDRTRLETNDTIQVTATVTNNRRATAKMVIVDLGLPPGFTLIPDRLNELVKKEVIEKYSTTGRQIIVYLRQVEHDKPVEISYELLAKFPLKAQSGASAVYEYYNPEIRSEASPIDLEVSQAK
ncbi:MAG: hypothetical protein JW810_03515 [Sedimentisphaerales bacterium]|nr:hypothetical protein [Sedimentisphaerales bacterium]